MSARFASLFIALVMMTGAVAANDHFPRFNGVCTSNHVCCETVVWDPVFRKYGGTDCRRLNSQDNRCDDAELCCGTVLDVGITLDWSCDCISNCD
ncbi:hypothetical protein EV363DRAFT_1583476 [Boletus edulis]|uniref:Uncharacterized protein n=1 Tax=Boletus edulis BED1 TaxID=1328754 RepID=A0AAD4C077_BOLED|nr:hypothetical protein EV363DRAFT_1583476 [Boletus edulis]KAF8421916.1 hypothetical protein L210DRAFT_3766024 [Boletus edulis BED1]KAF8444082.1 hypothetical protein L210DRAFT_3643636 [Boletus edulis BED1]